MYITTFEVTGQGRFPTDMLRYDQCWPTTTIDVHSLEHKRGRRTLHLSTVHRLKNDPGVTVDRWISFGWVARKLVTRKLF